MDFHSFIGRLLSWWDFHGESRLLMREWRRLPLAGDRAGGISAALRFSNSSGTRRASSGPGFSGFRLVWPGARPGPVTRPLARGCKPTCATPGAKPGNRGHQPLRRQRARYGLPGFARTT